MNHQRNLYKILQVQAEASGEVIKAAYRTLMKSLKNHPDLGGSHSEASLINGAYHILGNPMRRAKYDNHLSQKPTHKKANHKKPADPSRRWHNNEDVSSKEKSQLFTDQQEEANKPIKAKAERRGWRRTWQINKGIQFTQQEGKEESGIMIDLSPTGIRFRASRRIPLNNELGIKCLLFRATGQVMSCHKERNHESYVIGVVFILVDFKKGRGTFLSTSA